MKKIKLKNKVEEALELPTLCNLNPRSLYNKIDEFRAFIINEEIDVTFLSESWERDNIRLKDLINLEEFEVISNFSQRKEIGGRPAPVANKNKYHIKDITNNLVQIPWGVEAVWCLLTPVNVTPRSKIKNIACCSFYFKPDSKKQTAFIDHISDTYIRIKTNIVSFSSENIVKNVREASDLNQWKNTTSVINWFKNIKNKNKYSFIKFDICDFFNF